jgi:hypothetical protein
MNVPIHPYHLHAARLLPDSPVTPGKDLPLEVSGQPATYYWKDTIHAGSYVHPAQQFSLSVDRARLNRWADTGAQMLAAGVAIPINCDHSHRARDVVGYVKAFRLDGDRLLALCQFIGDDAALMAARNLVSVGIDPHFTDGQARQWGEAIVHLALTPVPVVPNQGEFVQASLANSEDTLLLSEETPPSADEQLCLACTPEQLAALCELIPGGADITPSDCITRVVQHLRSAANSDEEVDDSGDSELAAQLSAAGRRIAELSARLPPVLGEEGEAAMVESATARFDAAVACGGLSPAARDRLIATLVRNGDGKTNLIALSRSANSREDRALALTVADILIDNQPIEPGERTGLQALARPVPGEESSPIEQLRQYMTKMASVSGISAK